ncbi:hypothetical protein BHM03_00060226 [Ensete ventricosum]|nr:hypothetical protein BHM03_00060226 [Ensete ventricosum]
MGSGGSTELGRCRLKTPTRPTPELSLTTPIYPCVERRHGTDVNPAVHRPRRRLSKPTMESQYETQSEMSSPNTNEGCTHQPHAEKPKASKGVM